MKGKKQHVRKAMRTAAVGLTEKMTQRDAGAILGVSHQYVQKLGPRNKR